MTAFKKRNGFGEFSFSHIHEAYAKACVRKAKWMIYQLRRESNGLYLTRPDQTFAVLVTSYLSETQLLPYLVQKRFVNGKDVRQSAVCHPPIALQQCDDFWEPGME
jgi:hypothetical protein